MPVTEGSVLQTQAKKKNKKNPMTSSTVIFSAFEKLLPGLRKHHAINCFHRLSGIPHNL